MMLTARIKSCAAAVCVLAGCLLLPNAQAKAESISLPEPGETVQTQSAPAAKSAQAETAVVTPLALETVALPVKEEAVTEEPLAEEASVTEEPLAEEASVTEEAPEEAAEETPAPEADNAIARATKADHERPDDLVKLGDFIATAYCVTGQTSTGTQTTVGRTLAVNPYVIPYGTEVWLYLEDGTFAGDFIAEDTGSNMLANPNVIDIYMGQDSYNDCILWGAQNVEVYIRATAESETAQ
ncbi:hypothetical protein [Oscillospiraceae bacterium]|nr:hypothetical protein [Oscillospiraceae bacterium]